MAQFDLPAAFTYIRQVTGRKIHYIGHSQGTLTMFIALTQHYKGVEENLASFCAFGPVIYLKQQKSKLFSALAKTDLPEELEVSIFITLEKWDQISSFNEQPRHETPGRYLSDFSNCV